MLFSIMHNVSYKTKTVASKSSVSMTFSASEPEGFAKRTNELKENRMVHVLFCLNYFAFSALLSFFFHAQHIT